MLQLHGFDAWPPETDNVTGLLKNKEICTNRAMHPLQDGHAISPDCFAHAASLFGIKEADELHIYAVLKRITAMAAYQTTRPVPFGAISTFRFVQFAGNVLATVVAWNDARVTRNALGKLSDRELDDIGLCRGDINMISALDRI